MCGKHHSLLFILSKSRMRKRARTDLRGGRSVMVVPTATVTTGFGGSIQIRSLTATRTRCLQRDSENGTYIAVIADKKITYIRQMLNC